jgi:hypothetical protein
MRRLTNPAASDSDIVAVLGAVSDMLEGMAALAKGSPGSKALLA